MKQVQKHTSQKYIIIKDRVELFKDFTISLLYCINHYYIDYETINESEDIRNFYLFCFNKICDEFLLEGINFKNNKELREYFYSYYYNQFFTVQDNSEYDTSLKNFENFWKNIFKLDRQENKNIINVLIEIYTIFNKSIDKEIKLVDIT